MWVWSSVNLYGSHAGICANVSPSFAIWYSSLMPLSSSGILCWGMAIALHISGVNICSTDEISHSTRASLQCRFMFCLQFLNLACILIPKHHESQETFLKFYSIPRHDMLLLSWSHSLVLALRPRNLPNWFLPLFLQLI